MTEETICAAKDIEVERVELEVYASNLPAISIYEKRGFIHEGVKKKARKIDGAYDDILVITLFI